MFHLEVNSQKEDILNIRPINKRPLMTLILGSRCKDGTVLVADRKITIGNGEDFDYDDKLFGEIRHVVYGSAGMTTMFELFRGHVMNYVNANPGEITYQNATVRLAQFAYEIFKKYDFRRDFYFEVLVAIQPRDKPSILNLISGYGQPHKVKDYHIIGSGAPYAKVFLKKCLNDVTKMSMEQIAQVGYFVIKYIENFRLNYTVGGEPMIWFIPDDEKGEDGEKMDYPLEETRPDQFKSIKNKAMERFHKHEEELNDLFKGPTP
jgi:20S proteasome alpha/beta subunit